MINRTVSENIKNMQNVGKRQETFRRKNVSTIIVLSIDDHLFQFEYSKNCIKRKKRYKRLG